MRQLKLWHAILQLAVLILVGLLAWTLLHSTSKVPEDVYPFLTSLPPNLILDAQTQEGHVAFNNAWMDIVAVESVVDKPRANLVTQRLAEKGQISALRELLPPEEYRAILHRRQLLSQYPYYQPEAFLFPVAGHTWYEDTYGASREGGKRRHEGTDLFGPEGTPIVSVCSGTIEKLGWNKLGGERVGIRGEDGAYYYYAHLQRIAPGLWEGKHIKKGTLIGYLGHTGDALTTPDHLHFGIESPNGEWINPYPFLVVWQHYSSFDRP